jgi:hypothetical protein
MTTREATMSTTWRAGLLLSMMGAFGGVTGCAETPAPLVPISSGSGVAYAPHPVTPAASAVPAAKAAPVAEAPADKKLDAAKDAAPREQPGLGTEWGETRRSEVSMVSFERADAHRPSATASLSYNDEEGARAVAGGAWPVNYGMVDSARGLVKIGLRDENGRLFPGFTAGGKDVVVGEAGRRYTILLHNNTDRRVEVVLSVDGLDVLDGRPASFDKRGYILDARGDVEVDGFRRSLDAVAAFRFGSVRGSYAGQKYGDVRNVGVIGLAVFGERGSETALGFPWTAEEVRRRKEANPFPGELASSPVH